MYVTRHVKIDFRAYTDSVALDCLQMPEDTFSLNASQIWVVTLYILDSIHTGHHHHYHIITIIIIIIIIITIIIITSPPPSSSSPLS